MADTEPFDATDPAAIDNVERDSKRKEREDRAALKILLNTKIGRAFICRRFGAVRGELFVAGHPDVTAYNLGQEIVGRQILIDALRASQDLYALMLREQQEEEDRISSVREREAKNREAQDKPPSAEDLMAPLPPPAGFPGGPKLRTKLPQGKWHKG